MKTHSSHCDDAVLDRITEQFFELDRCWRFTQFNKRAEAQLRTLGLDPATLLGQVLWDVFPNATPEEALRRAMAERDTITDETFYVPLGEWIENRICPTSNGGLAVFQRYKRAVGCGVWKLTTGEMIWSAEAHRIYGFDPAIATPSLELLFGIIHPEDRARVAETVETVVRERGTYDLHFRIVLKNGVTKQIHSVGQAVLDAAGTPIEVIGTIVDETEPRLTTATRSSINLSCREEEVLRDSAWGYANQEIAKRLGISVRTVEVHKTHGMRKTNMHSRLDVIRYALLHGWLQQL
jgi:DNA-binding CsgD family transcriptional regulator/PAS domain-containing protein